MYIYIYIYLRPWAHISRSWGNIYIYIYLSLSLSLIAVVLYGQCLLWFFFYIYIYITILGFILRVSFVGVFACVVHSTSSIRHAVPSKCVTRVGSTRWHEPFREHTFLVENWTFDLISEFTQFNLVIRLSKVKQLAFFPVSPCRLSMFWIQLPTVPETHQFSEGLVNCRCFEQLPAVPGAWDSPFFRWFCIAWSCDNNPFLFNVAWETDRSHALHMTRFQDMLSGVVLLVFWSSGEVQLCT